MTFYRSHQLKKAVENSGSVSWLGTIFNKLSRLCKTSYACLKKTEHLFSIYLPVNMVRTTLDELNFKDKLQFSRTKIYFINWHSLTPYDHPIG